MYDKAMLFALVAVLSMSFAFLVFYGGTSGFDEDHVKQFTSCDEMNNFVKAGNEYYSYEYYGGLSTGVMRQATTESAVPDAAAKAGSDEYSTTNIQVEGVDEADIVKNDGKYIYTVSGNKLVIVDAYPAENAEILAELELDGTPSELFINGDKLVVFGSDYSYSGPVYYERYYYSGNTFIKVYDVSDRSNPELKRDLSVNGSYFDSRMIGDYVYVIIDQPVYVSDGPVPIPMVKSATEERAVCNCNDVYYFDIPDSSRKFTTIMSINTQNDNEAEKSEVFLMGTTQDIFVSLDNIYVTYMKRLSNYDFLDRIVDEAFLPFVPGDVRVRINQIRLYNITSYSKMQEITSVVQEYYNTLSSEARADLEKRVQEKMMQIQEDIAKEMEKTVIHKIAIANGNIEYKAQGYAPGNVLNQFSMDEYNGYFRIATTTGRLARTAAQATSSNHVYVLDSELNIVGSLEDLAPGESIYSARFMGDRCYLVTFRKVDPLFVIDLTDPYNPAVLGKLKIPGYSDYLHPYDENHIIGVGKEAVAAEQGDFSWYQGVKLSLFDVSDVENPKEVSKVEIGDRGTDSYALSDHKAFLFSKSKNLLVIPILLAEIDEDKYAGEIPPTAYGDYVFQGAYVFELTLENGFVEKGRVTHVEGDELLKSGYYFYSSNSVKRSLYIGNTLYTLSDNMIKMNSLDDLSELNALDLPYEDQVYPMYE